LNSKHSFTARSPHLRDPDRYLAWRVAIRNAPAAGVLAGPATRARWAHAVARTSFRGWQLTGRRHRVVKHAKKGSPKGAPFSFRRR